LQLPGLPLFKLLFIFVSVAGETRLFQCLRDFLIQQG
jgi:hypothetical protein